jgi:hypothetical protein
LNYLFLPRPETIAIAKKSADNRFPLAFFGGVFLVLASVVVINQFLYDIRPGNSLEECTNGCAGNPGACDFCDCLYNQGKGLDSCLKVYRAAKKVK